MQGRRGIHMRSTLSSAGSAFLRRKSSGSAARRTPRTLNSMLRRFFPRRAIPWKALQIDEARGVLKSVLKIAATSYDTARMFACAIHKKSFPHADPVELAFEDLCQRFDYFLGRKFKQGEQHRGMIILDRTTRETSLQNLSREFRKIGTVGGRLKISPTRRFLSIPKRRD